MDRIIEVTGEGRHLCKQRGFLVIREGMDELGKVPLEDIGVVIANGHGLTFSCSLAVTLSKYCIPLVICDDGHRPTSLLLPIEGHHKQSALFEAQANAGKPLKKRLWQQIVCAKLRMQAEVLESTGKEPHCLRSLIPKVASGDSGNIEAIGAKRYWHMLFGSGFKRDRDAEGVNTLLNYGYMVLRAATTRAILGAGLHPSFGLHHRNAYNSLRLSDDLIEPFRPAVDRRVIILATQGVTEMTQEVKKTLAESVFVDLVTKGVRSPVVNCMKALAVSLAQVFSGTRKSLSLPTGFYDAGHANSKAGDEDEQLWLP